MNGEDYCFTSTEITSRISTSKIIVFTFYLNERFFGTNQAFGG